MRKQIKIYDKYKGSKEMSDVYNLHNNLTLNNGNEYISTDEDTIKSWHYGAIAGTAVGVGIVGSVAISKTLKEKQRRDKIERNRPKWKPGDIL
jgi:hypothetical protein